MKKTLLLVMVMMVLIAASGCRADDRKEQNPMTSPSAEVLPDNNMNDGDLMDGENAGEIPENGVDSGNTQNNGDMMQNEDPNMQNGGAADNAENNGNNASATAVPELVPSEEAAEPNTSENVKK